MSKKQKKTVMDRETRVPRSLASTYLKRREGSF